MTLESTNARMEVAKSIAWSAGQVTLKHFQKESLTFEQKADRSPVTIADRECETYLREEIKRGFPDDGIVGEEFGETEGSSGYRWILDPIDGTKSFITGVPLFGTMVAVEKDGQALIGAVYIPGLDEGVFASVGHGCWHQKGSHAPQRASVSNCSQLENATVVTSEVETFAERDSAAVYERLADTAYFARTWGDCYGYMLVATGRVDLMIDPILNIWDAAAVQPIINEAGGKFSDWDGRERIDSGDAVGSNGHIHADVLNLIRQNLKPA